jgi:CDGSH-type Zn-finger protein
VSGRPSQDGRAGDADAQRPTGGPTGDGAAEPGTDRVAERDETPAAVPEHEDVRIVPYRDGPLIVRGPITITDQEGNVIDAGRSPVALCRCGRSRIRPFCDGTHTTTKFRAPSGRESR